VGEATAAVASTPKLQVEDLGLVYRSARAEGHIEAIASVSFEVGTGQFTSIVGPSGCGKSTLLNIVDGLLSPTRGSVRLNGREVRAPGNDRAMVFQDPALLPWRTVLGNIVYGLECQGVAKAAAHRIADELIALVGLEGFEHSFPHQLSGGMQQRVNLARALAVDPEVLLMDEPFAALDAQTREIMQDELLYIWQRARKTVLFVTHQIEEAVYLSDRVVVLSKRPSRVREVVDLAIPRPRDPAVKRSPAFMGYVERVWSLIQIAELRANRRERDAHPLIDAS
jgi:NitT/TauT family transport system ATP-binding protein